MATLTNELDVGDFLGAAWASRSLRDEADDPDRLPPARHGSFAEYSALIPTARGTALDFGLFPFQAPTSESSSGPGLPGLYSDEVADARDVAIIKSTQVGVSEWLIRGAIRHVDEYGETAIYAFPTDDTVKEFGQQRFVPMIERSTYLQSRILRRYIGNAHQKRIGQGFLYLRGSVQRQVLQRAAKAQSTDAQYVVFDEYDDLDQRTVEQMERRTSGAASIGLTARFRRVGVPTINNWGIAAQYAMSDRRRWHVTCGGCGVEQVLEWDANVRWRTRAGGEDRVCRPGDDVFANTKDVLRAWRACRECEAELDVADGRWLADDPDAETIGYHVSRLIVPNADLASIVAKSRLTGEDQVRAFFQNDLGLPYESGDEGLAREVVERMVGVGTPMRPELRTHLPITMGVDVASARVMHYRVSCLVPDDEDDPDSLVRRVCLKTGTVPDFNGLPGIMRDFGVWLCAVDAAPERQMARGFAAMFPGRVVLAQVRDNARKAMDYDADQNIVVVDRTDLLDAAVAAIKDRRNVLPSDPPPFYVEHLTSMKRVMERNRAGVARYRYVTVSGPGGEDGRDDFLFADAYDLVAKEMLAQAQLRSELDDPGTHVGGPAEVGRTISDDYFDAPPS